MAKQRKKFDTSLKLEVVRMIKEQGLSVQSVSESMSIGPTAIRRWVTQYGAEENGQPGINKPLTGAQQRIRQLEVENRQLRKDVDILKKHRPSLPANARLYRDLAEREAKIRRLVDANIIGIFFWDLNGRILEANNAFLLMVGYDREDLASMRVRWTDLTPPEWRDRDERTFIPELKATGRVQPYEKEFFRKDGGRVPVLIGGAVFEEDAYQGVAFVIDLTERKAASDAMREVQMELAHANRLATMGQLAASIAHELNQPIGAARNSAHAALRFLARDPPDLREASEALECVVIDTYRAGDIIGRIRDQVKKVPPCNESVDLTDAIGDVIALVRGELTKNCVTVHTHLAEALPPVRGDRVQLQQVILNLILNAIEAMVGVDAEVRTLVICTESRPSEGLLVTVGDSGPGIAPEDRERVFESFYTTKAGGLGIGLSICRSIIDAHGGKLWADAHQPHGAAFRFTLPALT